MFPILDSTHVAEGLGLLTDHYKGKKVITGLTQAYLNQVQKLETAIWTVINSVFLSTPPVGVQLDTLGILVGQPRSNLSDTDYLTAIRARIRANRSQGTAEDIIAVTILMLAGSQKPNYLDAFPAAFLVEIANFPSALIVASLLSEARSLGVYGELHYTTWATGNDFMWSSRASSSAGQGTWGSRYDATVGGLMCAAAGI